MDRFRGKGQAIACFCAGIVVMGITATMNLYFGESLGATASGKIIYSIAALVCDVAGIVVFGMVAGRMIAQRRWLASVAPAIVLILATGWSILSMMGFGATEQLSSAAARQEVFDRAKAADATQAGYLTWLKRTVTHSVTKTERRDLLAAASTEIAKSRTSTGEVKILPDAQAELLAKISGRPIGDIQIGRIAYLSILLILIKAVSFSYSGYLSTNSPSKSAARATGYDDDDGEEESEPNSSLAANENTVVPLKPAINTSSFKASGTSPLPLPTYTKLEAREDIEELIAQRGSVPSQNVLCARWNRPKPTVSRWISEFESRGLVSRVARGSMREIGAVAAAA